MDAFQLEIARFLAAKAARRSRATYQQVGEAVGWGHLNGRGLGSHLEVILRHLADQGLPPLTTILVKKGERYPPEDAMEYIRTVLGSINIETAQQQVFDFDWGAIPVLAPTSEGLAVGRSVWLTSFWGFAPEQWGCIGFADQNRRNRFLRTSRPGTLVAIYVTKGKGPDHMRGKVVGILEVSHNTGDARDFISGDLWEQKESDPASRDKWLFAVQVTRAWRVIPEDWRAIEDLLPIAYESVHPEYIGSNGVPVSDDEAERLFQLDVYEVPVYGQARSIDASFTTLEAALSPSRAVPPPSSPYWVGETDGPKHLYILRLAGDTAAYLGRAPADVEGKWIIKVGFSKSPLARRDQIQSAYPRGAFNWTVFKPDEPTFPAPYSNAAVATAGEDAMKARLVRDGAEILGGEFFLAEEWLVRQTWTAGRFASDQAESARPTTSE